VSSSRVIDLVVAERKKELERRRVVVEGDSVTASAVDDTAAEVVFTVTPADVDAMRRNELDLSVAFMRGTMKMAGDSGVLFHVLPVLTRHASVLVGSA
jgi:putative sterol carrier protein